MVKKLVDISESIHAFIDVRQIYKAEERVAICLSII